MADRRLTEKEKTYYLTKMQDTRADDLMRNTLQRIVNYMIESENMADANNEHLWNYATQLKQLKKQVAKIIVATMDFDMTDCIATILRLSNEYLLFIEEELFNREQKTETRTETQETYIQDSLSVLY